ncbi:ABC transporter permease [Pseudofulvimonas gallinarii]|uniref:Putative ABC transport system permease protein n=1 Tax=Pseudofulvimonas gallinarii TaxID=634155 RepID=A0A4R3LLT4_9GAMM|nr:ABC transporter permease [Pseudofulvimonas gallinarii]TCT01204.1 putative ABC transport system permease protein [Pseudofulvimonas gallinarii]THD14970.1 peptide ABC transporter permease [Pseudofulvimonas gallinarii]
MFRLALKSLLNRRGTVLLTVFTIALSTALLVGVERVRSEARSSFASTLSGTDLIVGARAGTVQLLLYSVFRLGEPTANVSWATYQQIAAAPAVAWTVPISLGDSHRGYRVLGTTGAYFEHYRFGNRQPLAFAHGEPFAGVYEAVLGSEVAAKLGYSLGDDIVIAHGIGRVSFSNHDDKPFRIAGILAPTGTPVDRTVHVPLAAIEAIHLDWQSGTRLPGRGISAEQALTHDLTPRSITAFLVGLKSRVATFQLQRQINEYRGEALSAILPGVALQQLWSLTGVAENALRLVAACVVIVGILGMSTALLTTLNERRREMAILRSVGARPRTILGLLCLEAMSLTLAGIVLGVLLLYAILAAVRGYAASQFGLFLGLGLPTAAELYALAAIFSAGLVAGMVPAWLGYRRSLSDGLAVRT